MPTSVPKKARFTGADGHPEIELALAKLYEETGEKRYLTLSQYLIDVRGQDPQFYTKQLKALNGDSILPYTSASTSPPTSRPPNLCATSRPRMATPCASATCALVWPMWADCSAIGDSISTPPSVSGRTSSPVVCMLTGAIGSTHVGESFTYDYDLPNDTMYSVRPVLPWL